MYYESETDNTYIVKYIMFLKFIDYDKEQSSE